MLVIQSNIAPEFFKCLTVSGSSLHAGMSLRAGTPAVQTNPLTKTFPLTENGTPNRGLVLDRFEYSSDSLSNSSKYRSTSLAFSNAGTKLSAMAALM